VQETVARYYNNLVFGVHLRKQGTEQEADGNTDPDEGVELRTRGGWGSNKYEWGALSGCTYTVGEHVRLLLDTWSMAGKGKNRGPLREHFGFAVRHSMLLLGDEPRRLNLAHCRMVSVANQYGGRQPVSMLAFAIDTEFPLLGGDQHYRQSLACRHMNVIRCSVGAMAFYLLSYLNVGYRSK